MTLSFKKFETESGFDVLRIYDGETTDAIELSPTAGYSGSALPNPITSTGPSLLIVFTSDVFTSAKGFTFAWTSSDGTPLPFDRCTHQCHTSSLGDHVCNPGCYNHACSWDLGDCEGVCNMTTGCQYAELGDGTCDVRCLNVGCRYDSAGCGCNNKLVGLYGYATDGSDDNADYKSSLDACWLISPGEGNQSGRRIALTFSRFDVERTYDYVEIFDGATIIDRKLTPMEGLSGLHPHNNLRSLGRNSVRRCPRAPSHHESSCACASISEAPARTHMHERSAIRIRWHCL